MEQALFFSLYFVRFIAFSLLQLIGTAISIQTHVVRFHRVFFAGGNADVVTSISGLQALIVKACT